MNMWGKLEPTKIGNLAMLTPHGGGPGPATPPTGPESGNGGET